MSLWNQFYESSASIIRSTKFNLNPQSSCDEMVHIKEILQIEFQQVKKYFQFKIHAGFCAVDGCTTRYVYLLISVGICIILVWNVWQFEI